MRSVVIGLGALVAAWVTLAAAFPQWEPGPPDQVWLRGPAGALPADVTTARSLWRPAHVAERPGGVPLPGEWTVAFRCSENRLPTALGRAEVAEPVQRGRIERGIARLLFRTLRDPEVSYEWRFELPIEGDRWDGHPTQVDGATWLRFDAPHRPTAAD